MEIFCIHSNGELHMPYISNASTIGRENKTKEKKNVYVLCSLAEWNRILIMSFIHTYYTLTHTIDETKQQQQRTHWIVFILLELIVFHVIFLHYSILLILTVCVSFFSPNFECLNIWIWIYINFFKLLSFFFIVSFLYSRWKQNLAILSNPERKWFGFTLCSSSSSTTLSSIDVFHVKWANRNCKLFGVNKTRGSIVFAVRVLDNRTGFSVVWYTHRIRSPLEWNMALSVHKSTRIVINLTSIGLSESPISPIYYQKIDFKRLRYNHQAAVSHISERFTFWWHANCHP